MVNESRERFNYEHKERSSTKIQHYTQKNNLTQNIQKTKLSFDKQNIDSRNFYAKKIRNEGVYEEETSVEISHIEIMSEEYHKNDDYEHEMIENLNVS